MHAHEGDAADEDGDAAVHVALLALHGGVGDRDHAHRDGHVQHAADQRQLRRVPSLRIRPCRSTPLQDSPEV